MKTRTTFRVIFHDVKLIANRCLFPNTLPYYVFCQSMLIVQVSFLFLFRIRLIIMVVMKYMKLLFDVEESCKI